MKNSHKKYEMLGQPFEWVQYANELLDSSELLYKEKNNSILTKVDKSGKIIVKKSGISRTYFLLIGFAIENIMKAHIISMNPNYIKNGKIERSISSNHNLFELSKRIENFEFKQTEINLLKTLTEGIPYWTRYPIPKRFENITEEKILNGTIRKTFLGLFEKMEINVYKQVNRFEDLWHDTEIEKKIKE